MPNQVQRKRQTPLSTSNAKKVQKSIQTYCDPRVEVHFSAREGFYYLSRNALKPEDKWDAACLEAGSAMFSDAAKRNQLVVGYPISVDLMENYHKACDYCISHLKRQDMWSVGESREERIKNTESAMSRYEKQVLDDMRFKASQDRQAAGREFYRSKLAAKVNMGGHSYG